jgi:hypothetical protein
MCVCVCVCVYVCMCVCVCAGVHAVCRGRGVVCMAGSPQRRERRRLQHASCDWGVGCGGRARRQATWRSMADVLLALRVCANASTHAPHTLRPRPPARTPAEHTAIAQQGRAACTGQPPQAGGSLQRRQAGLPARPRARQLDSTSNTRAHSLAGALRPAPQVIGQLAQKLPALLERLHHVVAPLQHLQDPTTSTRARAAKYGTISAARSNSAAHAATHCTLPASAHASVCYPTSASPHHVLWSSSHDSGDATTCAAPRVSERR